jgi:hypothetical protein
MTCAALNRARLAPVSDDELLEAKDAFVSEQAEQLLKTDLIGLFAGLNGDEAEILHKLMTGSMLDLVELQARFRDRMQHEARTVAALAWTASEAARAAMRIQDGRGE